MLYCPKCGDILVKSTKLIEGHTLNKCQKCQKFNLEGQAFWVEGGPKLLARLLGAVEEVEVARNIDHEAMYGPWDERWDMSGPRFE